MTLYSNDDPGKLLRDELGQLSLGARLLLVGYLLVAGVGGEYATFMLLDLGETWFACAIALFIVEPNSLACLVALVTIAAPDSAVAQMLFGALRRASVAAALVLFCFVVGIAGLLAWTLWVFLRG